MNRLYDTKVDEERWKVEIKDNGFDKDESYKLEDKKNKVIYHFKNIIGLEQVTDDEFLVFKRATTYNKVEIVRYKLQKGMKMSVFCQEISRFHFISDDRILFTFYDGHASYRCRGVYSIKNNSMLEEANWLEGTAIEIIKDDKNPNRFILYFEREITSDKLGNKKILFTVDPNTLQPNSICYSQFRNSYIEIKSKEDIVKIEYEDEKNMEKLSREMWQEEIQQMKEAKEKVLARRKNITQMQ